MMANEDRRRWVIEEEMEDREEARTETKQRKRRL
jgi:hypothetical protein